MKRRNFCFLIIFFITSSTSAFADKSDSVITKIKDASLFFFNDFKLNPALTGIKGGQNIALKAGIDKPLISYGDFYRPQLYSFLYDGSFGKRKHFATGLYFDEEKEGAIVNNSIGISFSGNLDISKATFYHNIRIGFSIAYAQMSIDFDKLVWGDQIDPRYGFIYYTQETRPSSLTKRTLNFSAGMWYNNPVFYCGFAVQNITQPNMSLFSVSKIPAEFIISSGGNIQLSDQIMLHPSFNASLLKGFKGNLNSYSPAVICTYRQKYNAGLSFMDLNKIGIHVGFTFVKHFTLLATCAFSTNTDLYQFGTIGYMGGKIQFNFNN